MVTLASCEPPTEGIRFQQRNINANVQLKDLGPGTLYIAESKLSWVCEGDGRGFSLEYPEISLHAVSRDPNSFPQHCLYLLLDRPYENEEEGVLNREREEEEQDDEEKDTDAVTEVRFIPTDSESLDAMFQVMADCQALHPDPDDSVESDGGGDEIEEYDENEEDEGIDDDSGAALQNGGGDGQQNGRTNRAEGDEAMDEGQFDDADAEPDGV